MQLSERQKRFCEEYIIDLNGTKAYMRAGYKPKNNNVSCVQSSKLLSNANITAYIHELRTKQQEITGITANKVLTELAKIGFSNIKDYLSYDAEGVEFKSSEEVNNSEVISSIESQKTITRSGGQGENKEETERVNFKLKLYDKVKALELLGKHLDIFNEKTQNSNPVPVSVNIIRDDE